MCGHRKFCAARSLPAGSGFLTSPNPRRSRACEGGEPLNDDRENRRRAPPSSPNGFSFAVQLGQGIDDPPTSTSRPRSVMRSVCGAGYSAGPTWPRTGSFGYRAALRYSSASRQPMGRSSASRGAFNARPASPDQCESQHSSNRMCADQDPISYIATDGFDTPPPAGVDRRWGARGPIGLFWTGGGDRPDCPCRRAASPGWAQGPDDAHSGCAGERKNGTDREGMRAP